MSTGLQDALQWSDPAQITTKYGKRWVRSWVIPQDFLEGFFLFWAKSKDAIKPKGYSVGKNNHGRWALFEWQVRKGDFREQFGKDNPVEPVKIITESTLPPYTVQNVEGLRSWQVPNVSKLCAALERHGAAIDGSDTGCHAKGQEILMYDGSIKNVEDVIIGDKLMGWDSTPREVLSLKRGRQQMVEIIPKKGNSWSVNIDHTLTVNLSHLPPNHHTANGYAVGIHDMSVKTWMGLNPTTRSRMKLFSAGVNCWKNTEQTIPPYLLGILLGDGGLSSRSAVTMTSADEEIWDYLVKYKESHGWALGETNEEITKRITNASDLFRKLRDYKLFPIACEDRFIPVTYKICSREQRLQILAGLLDTDGWIESVSGYAFLSKSKTLRNDVSFIARSLGFFVTDKTRQCSCKHNGKKFIGTYYKCTIIGDVSEIPLKIHRKVAPPRRMNKNPLLQGFTVKLLDEGDYYGFTLTVDGRYLLGDFVVTHNTGKTYVAVAAARELGLKVAVVCPKAVISPWNKVIKKHFGMKPVFVLNYESVKTGKYKAIGSWKKVSKISNHEKFVWNLPPDTLLIFDESHRLKGLNTQNSDIAIAAKNQKYPILCCSATNAINPIELKAVGYILGLYKNGKWSAYLRDHGCEKGRFGWEFSGDKKILAKLHGDLLIERGVRVRKEDIPGFPDCDTIAEAYNIDENSEKELKTIYKDMDKELTMLKAKCKSTKEWQINSMVIQLRGRQKAELLKVPLFVEMIEEALDDGMSVAVFVNFSETIRALAKRLKTNCIVWGENKGNERDKNIEAFQADEERVILVNVKAGGAGLSLHDLNGKYPRISIISPTPSAVDLRQVLGRIHRDGAKSKAVQKIVFVANTEEEDTCDRVKQKLEHLDIINDGDMIVGKIF